MFALTKAKTAVPRTYLPRADFNKNYVLWTHFSHYYRLRNINLSDLSTQICIYNYTSNPQKWK